jgi:hypothetical protein
VTQLSPGVANETPHLRPVFFAPLASRPSQVLCRPTAATTDTNYNPGNTIQIDNFGSPGDQAEAGIWQFGF